MPDYPMAVFVVSLFALALASHIGVALRRWRDLAQGVRDDFNLIQAATLTLLSLLIGFSFSMAVNRYDQRKAFEEAEANAIGTEFVRADLMGSAAAPQVRALLLDYLDQRILFYTTRDAPQRAQLDARTARLQRALWSAVAATAIERPTPTQALVVSGMNDVLNSQGYTQASFWNRIPLAAWWLDGAIALCCALSVGYGARHARSEPILMWVLPFVLSVAFFLIADIDSPYGGVIRVSAQNLTSLAQALRTP